ncbi:hypothetical protein L9Z42_14680 [Clostridioides difficile]|nr:hypothetical protein [Clostridioides difficile]
MIKNLSEEEVYIGTKNFLLKNNFILLGGQPPRGTDILPVIEIKSKSNIDKGSRDSYKPDLLAYKDGFFYIIECKPKYCKSDIDKLQSILTSDTRISCLYYELKQRNIFNNINFNKDIDSFKSSLKGVVSYSGKLITNNIVSHIIVKDFSGNADLII